MAFISGLPSNLGTSTGFSMTFVVRPTNPFVETTMTWTEAIASLPENWAGFYVNCAPDNGAGFLFIAVGPAGSEVRIATVAFSEGVLAPIGRFVPVSIPAGSRVAVSFAGRGGGTVMDGSLMGVPASLVPNMRSFSKMDMGPIRLDGGSLEYHVPPLSAEATANNTKSAWSELSISGTYATPNNILNGDSLGYAYDFIGISLFKEYAGTSTSKVKYFVDLAYGAAAAETVFAENLLMYAQSNRADWGDNYNITWIPWGRPAGDRISMRYQVQDVTLDVGVRAHLYGLR